MIYALRAGSASELWTALRTAGMTMTDEGVEVFYTGNHADALDVIGMVRGAPGFHANIMLAGRVPVALRPLVIDTPRALTRVFAGAEDAQRFWKRDGADLSKVPVEPAR